MKRTYKDICAAIRDRILAMLEKGKVPWRQPWTAAWPQNLFTRRRYHGLNVFSLTMAGFTSPYWCTPKQVLSHKGRIKTPELDRHLWVLFCHDGYCADIPLPHGVMQHRVPTFAKAYQVYNMEQTEGLERYLPKTKPLKFRPIVAAERLVAAMPGKPAFQTNPAEACYSAARDVISLPPKTSFIRQEEYYSTLFHELVHATGHESRLNRESLYKYHDRERPMHSCEELVAEMGAAMLCGLARIAPRTLDNSAAYIAGWLTVLKDDVSFLVRAGSAAQKACLYIEGDGKEGQSGRVRQSQPFIASGSTLRISIYTPRAQAGWRAAPPLQSAPLTCP